MSFICCCANADNSTTFPLKISPCLSLSIKYQFKSKLMKYRRNFYSHVQKINASGITFITKVGFTAALMLQPKVIRKSYGCELERATLPSEMITKVALLAKMTYQMKTQEACTYFHGAFPQQKRLIYMTLSATCH